MNKNKRIIMACILAASLSLTGCAAHVGDFMQIGAQGYGESATSSSTSTSDSSDTSEPVGYLTGEITTTDALDDIRILGRLATPSNFTITIIDNDEQMGSTRVTMAMDIMDNTSKVLIKDFDVKLGDFAIDVPDFDMYMSGNSIYLSENAMAMSMTLNPRMSMLSAIAAGTADDQKTLTYVARNNDLAKATDGILSELKDKRYVKLMSAELSAVPAVLMVPVSYGKVSGYFGKDMSAFVNAFSSKKDKFCRTDSNGDHVFFVDDSNATEFLDTLLSLSDEDILGLVMMDTYDDPFWTSITQANWNTYSAEVQARIDAYKKHWQDCKDAKSTYEYELTMSIKSDKDVHIKLVTNAVYNGVRIARTIDFDTTSSDVKITLPAGDKTMTPEAWEVDTKSVLDKYLADFADDSDDSDDSDD